MSASGMGATGRSTTLVAKAAEGDPVPGFEDSLAMTTPLLAGRNSSGETVFLSGIKAQRSERAPDFGWAVLLADAGSSRILLRQNDALPGGGAAVNSPPALAINDAGQVAIVVPEHGILLAGDGGLRWLARIGDPVPAGEATLASIDNPGNDYLFPPPAPFFGNDSTAVFAGLLSDGRRAILLAHPDGIAPVAVDGEPAPARADLTLSIPKEVTPSLKGSFIFFVAGAGSSQAVFRFSKKTGLNILAMEGEAAGPELPPIRSLISLKGSSSGSAAILIKVDEGGTDALLHVGGALNRVVAGSGDSLDGLSGPVRQFRLGTLDRQDRLLFLADTLTQAGLYLWEDGRVETVLVDGDATPLGGAFELSLPTICLVTCFRDFEIGPMNDSLEFAFKARVDDGAGAVLFSWRAGQIEPLVAGDELVQGAGDRLIQAVLPVGVTDRGSFVLQAVLCCGKESSAVVVTEPAAPLRRWIPLVAAGRAGSLELATDIEIVNHGLATGRVLLEVMDSEGALIDRLDDVLTSGTSRVLRLGSAAIPGLTNGYARLHVEGGAAVAVQTTLRILGPQGLISQTTVPATDSFSKAEIVAEVAAGSNTGIAVANPGDEAIAVRVRLRSGSGNVLKSSDLLLGPGRQQTVFVTELFPDLLLPFRGALVFEAEAPVVVTGIRQSGLQLSQLPVAGGAGGVVPPQSFVNAFPRLPDPDDPHDRIDIERITPGPAGRLAIETETGEIWLVDGPESIRLAAPGMQVAGIDFPISHAAVVGFSPLNDLLVDIRFDSAQPGSRQGLFRSRTGRLEPVFLDDLELSDGTRFLTPLVLNPRGELLLDGRRGDQHVLLVYDGENLEPLPTPAALPAMFNPVFGNDRRVAFFEHRKRALFVMDGQNLTEVARVGDIVEGRFFIDKLARLALAANQRLLFSAVSTRKTASGELATALLAFDGTGLRLLLISGDLVPGMDRVVVNSLEESHHGFDDPDRARFQVNAGGRIVVRTEFTSPVSNLFAGERRGFLLFDEQLKGRMIVPEPADFPDDAPFRLDRLPTFGWNERDQLLFRASSGGGFRGEGIYRWEDDSVSRAVSVGRRLSPSGQRRPTLLRFLRSRFTESGQGILFDVAVRGAGPDGLYLADAVATQRLHVPHVVIGEFPGAAYSTVLFLHNPGDTTALASVHLMDRSGRLIESENGLRLNPHQTRVVRLQAGDAFVGWATIEVVGAEIEAFERFSVRTPAGELLSEVTVPAVDPADENFWQGQVRPLERLDGGLAVVNPYNAPIEVKVELLGDGLRVLAQTTLQIPARGHRARLFSELFPGSECCGLFRLRAEFPVPAIALRLDGLRITSQALAP